MKAFRTIVMIAALCAQPVCVSLAQHPSLVKGFDAYPMVRTRNMFDPDRHPMDTAAPAGQATVAPTSPKAADYVALTGILLSGDKALAFFSGSRTDYDEVIPVNTEIAGAKVTKISSSSIEVDRNGKKVVVAVGQTVPFDDSPPGVPPVSLSDAAPAPAPPPEGSPSAAPTLPANLTDIIRRMMERRQHELQ